MSFSFEFSDEDIDLEDVDGWAVHDNIPCHVPLPSATVPVEQTSSSSQVSVVAWNLSHLISGLPDRISYSTLALSGPGLGKPSLIPRRALFDIRLQIIAETGEDNGVNNKRHDSHMDLIGLGDSDIEQKVYEGGFKSWEGANDLAELVMSSECYDPSSYDHLIELGCGTGLPLLGLFSCLMRLLARSNAAERQVNSSDSKSHVLTFADYNEDVLRLATLPNILLVWALQHSPHSFDPRPPSVQHSSGPMNGSGHLSSAQSCVSVRDGDGDLLITPELSHNFLSWLATSGVGINLISGPWTLDSALSTTQVDNPFLELLHLSPTQKTLVLGAETIYSMEALDSFTTILLQILRSSTQGSRGLVAAKQVYFGVGGGVSEFKLAVKKASTIAHGPGTVVVEDLQGTQNRLTSTAVGVGRWLGEVRAQI